MQILYNETLYLISKGDKPLEFLIQVTWDKQSNHACVVTRKGYIDGAKQEDIKEIWEGKNIGRANETEVNDQAISEAESIYKKLLDKGYKPTLEHAEEEFKGKTDASGRKMIMKAHKDLGKVVFPCFLQRKYDGMRFVVKREYGVLIYRSKYGKQLFNLEHLNWHFHRLKDGEEIDGELYIHGLSLQKIISHTKTQGENNKLICARLYDMLSDDNQWDRLKKLDSIVLKGKHAEVVETFWVENWEQVRSLVAQFWEEGYEGGILRNPQGKYEYGHRSYHLIKYKKVEEDEFEIVDVDEATGRDKGTGIFVCKTKEDKIFRARPMGTREERANYLNNKQALIGKFLTVKFANYTEDGIPFHAVGKIVRDYE